MDVRRYDRMSEVKDCGTNKVNKNEVPRTVSESKAVKTVFIASKTVVNIYAHCPPVELGQK